VTKTWSSMWNSLDVLTNIYWLWLNIKPKLRSYGDDSLTLQQTDNMSHFYVKILRFQHFQSNLSEWSRKTIDSEKNIQCQWHSITSQHLL
jgi:hypothetical protein